MQSIFLLIHLLIGVVALGTAFTIWRKEKRKREKIRQAISLVKKNNTQKDLLTQRYPIKSPRRNLQANVLTSTDATGQYITIDLWNISGGDYEIAAQLTALLTGNKCILKVFAFTNIFDGIELLKILKAQGASREIIEVEEQIISTTNFNQLLKIITIQE